MEKRFNREDELIKKLLNEAGMEKPSVNFKSQILHKIEARKVELTPYKPLISAPVWFLLAGVMLSSMLGLYIINAEVSFPYSINFDLFERINLPKIDLSRNMQYAIAFVALFFLQVPFLKRLMDNEYRL
ncbi:hypothetical protein GCM10023115_25760 [Pontixanthobacter gangjinensis]|uniref:Uncharacterized protein n=1 Tax=Christiangramia aestuarii TaxID=1028746 RepID=A0A7K1LLW3_9FLAO|nr:hypothetical protein [Christiangramia aestuarii]MUP41812.1 hypothetical protein [Christiangramia aestuarii]